MTRSTRVALRDEPDEERRELGEESPGWPETWSSDESLVKILQYKYVER
jgi:hypothetical protein